jgi:hypothetical protein
VPHFSGRLRTVADKGLWGTGLLIRPRDFRGIVGR